MVPPIADEERKAAPEGDLRPAQDTVQGETCGNPGAAPDPPTGGPDWPSGAQDAPDEVQSGSPGARDAPNQAHGRPSGARDKQLAGARPAAGAPPPAARPSRWARLGLRIGPDPLRNTVLGIVFLSLLSGLLMVTASLVGTVRAQHFSEQTEQCTRALLDLQLLRRGDSDVALPDVPGRDELERALLSNDPEMIRRAEERYEQAALRGLVEAEKQRASERRAQVTATALLLVGTLIGLLGLLYWLLGVLVRPMEDLVAVARRVRDGDVEGRVPRFTQPEFDVLAEAINSMLDSLQSRLQELEAGRRELESLVRSHPEAWLVVGPEGKVELTNRAAAEILGQDCSGKTLSELGLRGTDGGEWKGELLPEGGVALVARGSHAAPVPVQLTESGSEQGRRLLRLRNLAEEDRLEGLRQEAVATILHELAEPARRLADLAEQAGLETVAAQARQIRFLVQNFRVAGDLRRGLWSHRKERVEVSRLLAEVAEGHASSTAARDMALEVHCEEELWLAGDRAQLGLLLHAMVRRLLEGTPSGGRLLVTARAQSERVLFELCPEEEAGAERLRTWLNRPAGPADAVAADGVGLLRQVLKSHEAHLENEPGPRVRVWVPMGSLATASSQEPVEVDRPAGSPGVCWRSNLQDGTTLTWLRRALQTGGAGEEGALDVFVADLDEPLGPVPPGVPVLAVAAQPAERIEEFLRLDAHGLVSKDASPAELRSAVRRLQGGDTVLSPEAAEALRRYAIRPRKGSSAVFLELTTREQEIFRQITHGMSNREIAESLVISEGTVKTHINNMLRKLNLRDRVQIVLYAAQHNLLELGQPQDRGEGSSPG